MRRPRSVMALVAVAVGLLCVALMLLLAGFVAKRRSGGAFEDEGDPQKVRSKVG